MLGTGSSLPSSAGAFVPNPPPPAFTASDHVRAESAALVALGADLSRASLLADDATLEHDERHAVAQLEAIAAQESVASVSIPMATPFIAPKPTASALAAQRAACDAQVGPLHVDPADLVAFLEGDEPAQPASLPPHTLVQSAAPIELEASTWHGLPIAHAIPVTQPPPYPHDLEPWPQPQPPAPQQPAMPSYAAEPLARALGTHHATRNVAERREWTAHEDELIRKGVAIHGIRWRRVAAMLPGRSDDAVRNRWSRLRETTQRVAESGEPTPADAVPRGKPARAESDRSADGSASGSASKERGEGGRVSWTRAEDAIIIGSVQEIGHKWHVIAGRLGGRTEHAVRNRYNRLQALTERAYTLALVPPGPAVPTDPPSPLLRCTT